METASPVVNCTQHAMRYRPSANASQAAEPMEGDLVFPPPEAKLLPFFQAVSPAATSEGPAIAVAGGLLATRLPKTYAAPPVTDDSPRFPDGAVLLVSLVFADALKQGRACVPDEELEARFGGKNIAVLSPETALCPDCIRTPAGLPYATRLFFIHSCL